jgi:phosphoribosylformylglycinamidine cyclo-ligase
MSLTYRASGVDIEAAGRAKRRIQDLVRRTHTDAVLTRPGLFGGAVRLERGSGAVRLAGSLGLTPEGGAAGPAAVVEQCLAKLPAGSRPVAFLDYLAAAGLQAGWVEKQVEGFASRLSAPARIPLIGGETAEMPGVLRPGATEAVGALFGVMLGQTPGAAGSGTAAAAGGQAAAAGGPAAGSAPATPAAGRPCLVFSMDGVGTKTKIGVMARSTGGLALDIIHHSLDDILCQGAAGSALLFYVGCHRRDEALLEQFRAAAEGACARLGLSSLELAVAEKPGAYLPGEVDICAAVAGVGEEEGLLQGESVRAGDALVGLASDGLHTNGYSLARRALLEEAGLKLDARVEELGTTLAEALLAPHRNYAAAVLPLLRQRPSAVRAVAHVTGGGLADNLGRVIPEGLQALVRRSRWEVPPLFRLIQRCGGIPEQDPVGRGMYETFNMGIGLVLVVEAGREGEARRRLEAEGEKTVLLGEVRALPSGSAGGQKVLLAS